MFVLAEMKDVIRVTPEHFHQSLTDSITVLLNRKLANKVVLNVGLCIALYDITDIGHSYIFPGDGSSHTEVKFRYTVFRPVVEEIIVGKIKSCSREGVHVTLGFFDDILIPVNALQHPSRFDETDQAWVWEYPVEDGDKHDLFMDSGESIRFRVTSEAFEESLPSGPPGTECSKVQTVAPYRIIGGINEPGLGLLTWWEAAGQGIVDGGYNIINQAFTKTLLNAEPADQRAEVLDSLADRRADFTFFLCQITSGKRVRSVLSREAMNGLIIEWDRYLSNENKSFCKKKNLLK